MSSRAAIIRALADGAFQSGEALGRRLGISRTAVHKQVQALTALGLPVQAVRGRGYRLTRRLELLEPETIRAVVTELGRPAPRLEVLDEVDSTNRYLLERARQGAPGGYAVLAERQTAGRGRRGRSWVSPFARNLYLSVLWRFREGSSHVGMSLVAGIAAARALEQVGLAGIGLKWPNDLWVGGRKLGGVLAEMMGEPTGPFAVVVGIGINVDMPRESGQGIDQPWVDCMEVGGGAWVSRNRLAGVVLSELAGGLARFEQEGFSPFQGEWERRDAVAGQEVALQQHHDVVGGRAVGVDATGALLVEVHGRIRRYHSGEVSLRTQP